MTSNKIFYKEISELRDLFHKYGKFDDSNAKLDEISKYIAIYLYQLQNGVNNEFSLKKLVALYEKDKNTKLVKILKSIFTEVANSKEFLNEDKTSIFGNTPNLNIEENDDNFAYHLIRLVVNSVESMKNTKDDYNFDLLNESFGHFVRDNFRNHVEDAQYMTPYEAVELMCNMALYDLEIEDAGKRIQEFVVCDPCCGVGSFISTFYKKNKENNIIDSSKVKIVGQDKVARMVRMAKINMMLFNNHNNFISNGNSVTDKSLLDKYIGKVDLILTNPPFGARFSSEELKSNSKINFPLLNDLFDKNDSIFSSEVLFIDRCISLLKPGGKLLAVLPDSVISSAGINSTLRHRLLSSEFINIKSIIELPAVTFAQAGTRTKTSILYLEKVKPQSKRTKSNVFIGQCENIGFEVSTKKGATVKVETGDNDLIKIFEAYKSKNKIQATIEQKVLNESPSCVIIDQETLKENSWTPSHYNARKLLAVKKFKKKGGLVELVKLSEIAEFVTTIRKKEFIVSDSKCISVLHILNDDNLNYEEMLNYKPKYPGIVCKSGDLLFSKINPRILRVLVVPELDLNLTCSSEFEIINSKIDINNYGIKLLLMLPSVQTQINYLTSGTSSSHNRIKSIDLANVLIPLPIKNSELYNDLFNKAKEYEKRNKKINELKLEMSQLKKSFFELVS
jgi:type I restriction-modification system DNA methylase subunit